MSTTQDRILEAAYHLFGTVGFDATTTRAIADRSGVNRALIHYHFSNKTVLLEHLLDRYYGDLGKTLEKVLAGRGAPRKKLVRLVDTYMDFLVEHQNFSRIVQREVSGGRHVDRVAKYMSPLFETGKRFMEEASPATRTGNLSATHLLISFYGMIVSYVNHEALLEPLLGTDPLSKQNLTRRRKHLHQMVEMVLEKIEQREAEKKPSSVRSPSGS